LIYDFWLPPFDLRPLITSLWFTASDYLPLIYDLWLPPFDLRLLITSLWFTTSDYLPLIYDFWLPPFDLRLLITSLWFTASDYLPLIYGFLLPPFDLRLLITILWFTASDYLFCILDLRLLITSFVSSNLSYIQKTWNHKPDGQKQNIKDIHYKLYIFIHNEVRDFDKDSTQLEIRVNQVRDNESKMMDKHDFHLV
jgi:cytochrome c oxidase subunit IV